MDLMNVYYLTILLKLLNHKLFHIYKKDKLKFSLTIFLNINNEKHVRKEIEQFLFNLNHPYKLHIEYLNYIMDLIA